MTRTRMLALAAGAVLATTALAACGGGTAADTTTTAADTTTMAVTTTTTAAGATTTAATATTTAGGGPVEITVTAMNNLFDTNRIEVKAGQPVKIIFNNTDTASDEPHNIHFRTDTDDWFTPIVLAPKVETLEFTPTTPGTFTFFCDTHLATMVGEFIVTP